MHIRNNLSLFVIGFLLISGSVWKVSNIWSSQMEAGAEQFQKYKKQT